MKKLILISGKAQHGKDTVALMMKDALKKNNQRVLIIHNADVLKFIAKEYFGWNGEKDDKGRTLLQHLGTDIIRKNSPDFWVDFSSKLVIATKDLFDYVIIPDCRFRNEIYKPFDEYFINTTTIRVNRSNGNKPFDNGLSLSQQNHISETDLDKDEYYFDFVIANSGSLDELEQKVYNITNEIVESNEG